MNLLEELFLYFAKYVQASGVEKIFIRSAGSASEEYFILKEKALNISNDRRLPGITDYVFGVNEDTVKKRISAVKGIYLFVDYGNISSSIDTRNVKQDIFNIAVTLAKPTSSATFDQVDELLISDKLCGMLCRIRQDMRNDKSDSFTKRIIFPNEITPFFARELTNSYGWTLIFQMKGVDLV